MVAIKLELLLLLKILYVTDGTRRITNGSTVEADKRYVVYLVKAPNSNRIYDEWLCGGALVSTWFIITSAACVADVEYMYAIAGYKKYVPDEEIETDGCTKVKKKKVVYTCIPIKYELDYDQVEKWSFIDIALVKVESAYDLLDATFNTLCSYIPTVISINYVERYQKPGTDTLVYGWGHLEHWRQQSDRGNHNKDSMQYAASKIIDKAKCKREYKKYANMSELIDKYMICTSDSGDFNDKGEYLMKDKLAKLEGCGKRQLLNNPVLLNGEIIPWPDTYETKDGLDCVDDDGTKDDTLIDATRREDENKNKTSRDLLQNNNRTDFNRTAGAARKHGICQNDHGGPLVTWVGGNEMVIGVASVFRVTENFKCNGPYLFTSTQCNGAFLNCILEASSTKGRRRTICNSPPVQRGYDTVERYISWEHHPSGPADNERNANAKREKEKKELKSTQSLQGLLRFNMLVKMAKDQSTPILRQQRQRV